MDRKLKRRDFLKLSSAAVLGALAASCRAAPTVEQPTPTDVPQPTKVEPPQPEIDFLQPEATDTAPATVVTNGLLKINLAKVEQSEKPGFFVSGIEVMTANGWRRILEGTHVGEFATSIGWINASDCEVHQTPDGGWTATLTGKADGWEASETLTLPPGEAVLRRRQTYRFIVGYEAAITPGFKLKVDPQLRYTFPLRAWEQPLAGLKQMRSAVDWALPFPFHVWHDDEIVALYGVDRSGSPGTLDFIPSEYGKVTLRVYYPDTADQPDVMSAPDFGIPRLPEQVKLSGGTVVTLEEVIAARLLAPGEEPLLEAERIAAGMLMQSPPHAADLPAVASGIVAFYQNCGLWEADAFGPGRGWFTNMWVRTQTGPAKKRGEMSGYYDFGWGEGIAVEMMLGAVRNWKRSGDTTLLTYVDAMSRNIELFKRAAGDDQPYFDRSDGQHFGDFMMDVTPGRRIWTHSLGHTGSQLLQLYQAAPDYPNPAIRQLWLDAASSMARFFASYQKPNGDLQDIFDELNHELNTKPHRITARASVCGLWVRLGEINGDRSWTERALRLAKAVAPEINRYEYYNQMIDTLAAPSAEFTDGEAAYYVLEGLVPLYAATRDPDVLALCKKAAAYGIAWTYFFDLPKANNGVARGGQCCRMPDFPLLYPIGAAKGMTSFLDLYTLTQDPLFEKIAAETAAFIGNWQMHAPGQPWDGGMIHAMGQYCGKHWGPDLAGQVDTGMATGNSLAAIEQWLAHDAGHT